jgi:Uri superfamily endonuclease
VTRHVTYQLLIEVARPVRANIGRLGSFAFPAGRYIYTGSARRNFEARVARHLRTEKTLRWHVDYLLVMPGVRIAGVRRYVEDECAINQATPGSVPVPGFGASDCRAGCGSHLKYLD